MLDILPGLQERDLSRKGTEPIESLTLEQLTVSLANLEARVSVMEETSDLSLENMSEMT